MKVSTLRRSKAPRRPLSRSGGRASKSDQPVLVTKRKNVERVFDDFVGRLAARANLGLTPEQKLLAKLYAMHILLGIARKDPMFLGQSGDLFTENEVDITCGRIIQAACQGVQHEEFLPQFSIKGGGSREPLLLRGHGVTSNRAQVVLPFERLFGEELAHGIARYLVRIMKARHQHAWPNSVMKGESKEIWVKYTAPKVA